MSKRHLTIILLCLLPFLLLGCKKKNKMNEFSEWIGTRSDIYIGTPDLELKDGSYDLNFTEIHNYVIDYITAEMMPFFFVKEGEFDISGSNEEKLITVKCKCIKGTTVEDLDLFLSMVLNGIGLSAAEQDYRLSPPSVGADGAYTDFGTVFNTFELKIYATLEDGTVLRNDDVKPGQKIPVDPKYIME